VWWVLIMRAKLTKHPCPKCKRMHLSPEDHEIFSANFFKCTHCKEVCVDDYMVKNKVWKASGIPEYGGILHLACLEKLIGRPLALSDFQPDNKTNTMVRFLWARTSSP